MSPRGRLQGSQLAPWSHQRRMWRWEQPSITNKRGFKQMSKGSEVPDLLIISRHRESMPKNSPLLVQNKYSPHLWAGHRLIKIQLWSIYGHSHSRGVNLMTDSSKTALLVNFNSISACGQSAIALISVIWWQQKESPLLDSSIQLAWWMREIVQFFFFLSVWS